MMGSGFGSVPVFEVFEERVGRLVEGLHRDLRGFRVRGGEVRGMAAERRGEAGTEQEAAERAVECDRERAGDGVVDEVDQARVVLTVGVLDLQAWRACCLVRRNVVV